MPLRRQFRRLGAFLKEFFSKKEEFNIWTLQLYNKEQNHEFYEFNFQGTNFKCLCYILISLLNLAYVVPEMLQSKRNEIIWRICTQITLPLYAAIYFLRKKSPLAYEIGLPFIAFFKCFCAVWLKVVMVKNNSTMPVNPVYLTMF
jgi:hypothetical protein